MRNVVMSAVVLSGMILSSACDKKSGPVTVASTESELQSSFGHTGESELDVVKKTVYLSAQSRLYVTPKTMSSSQRDTFDEVQPTITYSVKDTKITIDGQTVPAELEVGGVRGTLSQTLFGDIDSTGEQLFKWTAQVPDAIAQKYKDDCGTSVPVTIEGVWHFDAVSDPALLTYEGPKEASFSHTINVDVRC